MADVLKQLAASPLVRSVYRVSGEDCFVVQVVCRRIEDVNALLLSLQETRAVQSSRTAFVLETLLDKDGLGPVEEALLVDGEGGGRERVRPRSARPDDDAEPAAAALARTAGRLRGVGLHVSRDPRRGAGAAAVRRGGLPLPRRRVC